MDNLPRMTEEQNDTRRLAIEALETAREARVLAVAASKEVGDVSAQLRGHITVLHALRETQLEQGARLDRLERRVDEGFARVDARFEQVDRRFEQVDARFEQVVDQMNARFDQLAALIKSSKR